MICSDCSSSSLREVAGELTCTICGLVNATDRLEYTPLFSENLEYENENNLSNSIGISSKISKTCETLNLPDSVSEMAIVFFLSYTDDKIIKGMHRKLSMLAAIYFAQGVMNNGARSKIDICFGEFLAGFMQECTKMEDHIKKFSAWNWILTQLASQQCNITGCIGAIMTEMGIPESKRPKIRQMSLMIFDKVKKSSLLVGVKDRNFHIGCTYIACEIQKIETIRVAGIHDSTLKKIVGIIHTEMCIA